MLWVLKIGLFFVGPVHACWTLPLTLKAVAIEKLIGKKFLACR